MMCIVTPWGVICIDAPVLIAVAGAVLTAWGWIAVQIRKRWKK